LLQNILDIWNVAHESNVLKVSIVADGSVRKIRDFKCSENSGCCRIFVMFQLLQMGLLPITQRASGHSSVHSQRFETQRFKGFVPRLGFWTLYRSPSA